MFRSAFIMMALLLSASAGAQGFDYNYITLQYSQVDFDDLNVDGDGISLGGSFAINQDFHAFGQYSTADLDFGVDANELSIGLGYNHSLTDAVDFVGTISYEYVEVEAAGFGSADDNGYGLGIGLRWAASEEFEVQTGIQYVDLGDSSSSTAFGAGFQYSFTEAFTVGLNASFDDDVTVYGIGGRFYFGQ